MFAWLMDAAYVTFLLAVSPFLLYRRISQRKPIAGWRTKLSGDLERRQPDRPCLWFHAVSVGEVLQLQPLVAQMRSRYADHEFVITTTTGTGFDVAKNKYPDCTVQFFPFDFSWAVDRALENIRPSLIVLVELELWPNFLRAAQRRRIPVAIINGRISDRSFRTYRKIAWFTRPLLESCTLVAAQNSVYEERFRALGAPQETLQQTGNIKFDGVETRRDNPQTRALKEFFGIGPEEIVFLAGSTQAPEEEYALKTYEDLKATFPALRLLLVPRHKERFEEVAELIVRRGHEVVRRSASVPQPSTLNSQQVLLLDTLGELGKAWGLAEIAFVGGSLTNRGGQNMIEPAGYGAAVLFGPNTWNFRDVTEALLIRRAAIVVHSAEEMTATVRELLENAERRRQLGSAAREFVSTQQGALARTVELLAGLLPCSPGNSAAA